MLYTKQKVCFFFTMKHYIFILQPANIIILCGSIPNVIRENFHDNDLLERAEQQCKKFEELFSLYSKCHNVFNGAVELSCQQIYELGKVIFKFGDQITSKIHFTQIFVKK